MPEIQWDSSPRRGFLLQSKFFTLRVDPMWKERADRLVGWLFWAKRPFETVFQSISGRLPERGRKKREMTDARKNAQTTPIRTCCKRNRPLPYSHPNCRTPRHWKFTQDHRTTDHPRVNKKMAELLPPKMVQYTLKHRQKSIVYMRNLFNSNWSRGSSVG